MDKKWTSAQQNAINSTKGSILVSAAAGSGKTSVLVERVIKQITRSDNPIDIEQFLIVTFTKAAAQEMKTRISNRLSQLIMKYPENTNLHRQQMHLKCASIGTIHSFCGNIVKENFYKLDISPKFRIADEQEINLIKDKAMQNTLNYFYNLQNPEFKTVANLFSNEKDDKGLEEVIHQIYDFTRALPFPEKWMDDKLNMYKNSQDSIWTQILRQNGKNSLRLAMDLTNEIIELTQNDEFLQKAYVEALSQDLNKINAIVENFDILKWDTLCNEINSFSFSKFKPLKNENAPIEKNIILTKRDYIKDIFKNLQKYFSFTELEIKKCIKDIYSISKTIFEIVRYFSNEIYSLKLIKNIADFNDLEHWAIELLTEEKNGQTIPSKIALEIAEKYREIMVDEYQDINEIQDTIFKMITSNENKIFTVGDVKQSIYKFRRSKPQIFLEKKEGYKLYNPQDDCYPAKIILEQNFRSTTGIIESINFIFKHLMSKKVGEIEYDKEESLTPGADYPKHSDSDVNFKIIEIDSADENSDISEAKNIAETIIKLISEGYSIYENGQQRPATYSDFCVLLRSSNAHAHIYAKEFYKHGVPAWSETNEKFLKTSEISTIISLLEIIDNPVNDIALISTMISPIFGFTIDELSCIRKIDENMPFYFAVKKHSENSNTKTCEFLKKIDLYRKLNCTMPCHELINHIYDDTDYPAFCLAQDKGEIKKANLILLREYAEKFENQYHKGLSGFLNFIENLKKKNSDLPPASISSETENSVKIMSIHKSKGLEFPICIIAGCARKFNFEKNKVLIHPDLGLGMKLKNSDGTIQYDNLIRRAISFKNHNEDISEELRILYVALTRAKQKLIIIASLKDARKVIQKNLILAGNKKTIPPEIAENVNSFAEWMILCISKSNLRNQICKFAEFPISEIGPSSSILNWDIEFIFANNFSEKHNIENKDDSHESIPCLYDKNWEEKIKQRFNFQYPDKNLAQIPLKVSASQLTQTHEWEQYIANSKPSFTTATKFTPTDKGTAMHKFMCYYNLSNATQNGINHELNRLVKENFIDLKESQILNISALKKFIKSPLSQRIRSSPSILREYRFSVKIPLQYLNNEIPLNIKSEVSVVMQGALDCAFLEGEEYVIVDYKTDKINNIKELYNLYSHQLKLYKYAIENIKGKKVKELIIYSFHLGEEYSEN